MMNRVQLIGLLAALLALGACNATPASQPVAVASKAATATTVVVGVVRAPIGITGIVPTGGGNIVPTGGGNVLPTGGGNVLPTGGGNLRVLALSEAPLANTTVYLADAAGQPYPLIQPVTTDAQGAYSFKDVPVGVTVMVLVRGQDTGRNKEAALQTLVRTSELGATANVDTSSSLVTLAVVKDLQGDLGNFNAAAFRTATDATARQLDDKEPPDLTDRAALLAKIDKLSQGVAELKTALDAIRQDIQDLKSTVAELKARLGQPTGPAPWKPGDPIPSPNPNLVNAPIPNGPNGGAGICAAPSDHEFELTGSYASYPVFLQIITPRGDVQRTMRFEAKGAVVTANFPEICPNHYVVRDAQNNVLAQAPAFVIPTGSKRVRLPI